MKQFIQNRNGLKVCVVVERPEKPGKLAFLMHGLGGNKQELHIRATAEAFLEQDYTLVTFDTTNSFGESDGLYEDATLTGYYNDLEDIISWAAKQPWYVEPFVLAGHSLGGISVSLFAEKHPEKVKALAPISSVVSGELTLQTQKYTNPPNMLEEWKTTGIYVSKRSNGTEKHLKWACMEDRMKYSVLPEAHKLTMPVLLITGSNDNSVPPSHMQVFYDALPGKKEMHIVDGAAHTYKEDQERKELKQLVNNWLQTV